MLCFILHPYAVFDWQHPSMFYSRSSSCKQTQHLSMRLLEYGSSLFLLPLYHFSLSVYVAYLCRPTGQFHFARPGSNGLGSLTALTHYSGWEVHAQRNPRERLLLAAGLFTWGISHDKLFSPEASTSFAYAMHVRKFKTRVKDWVRSRSLDAIL